MKKHIAGPETLPEFLKNIDNQLKVLDKIISALKERGEWGRYGLYATIGKQVGLNPAYAGQIFNGNKPVRETFVQKMAEYLGVSMAWLRGDSRLSYEEEVKWYRDEYKPGIERVVAGLNAVSRFGQGLSESELEAKLKIYAEEFPEVYKGMATVPQDRQPEVAEYVLAQASRWPRFVTQPPAEEE